MAESRDPLQIEEDQVFQKEQDVVELEAELHLQEQGVIEMERVYQRRAKAVISLLSYVAEQEDGLRRRAEVLGPRAVSLVEGNIEEINSDSILQELDFGMEEERRMLLERRLELLDFRRGLLESREEIFTNRHEKLESAEVRIAELEENLLSREMELARTLRKLIQSASELEDEAGDEDDESDEDDSDAFDLDEEEDSGEEEEDFESDEMESEEDVDAEDTAPGPRKTRRGARKRSATKKRQVRFKLEADMATDEGHHFFRYEDDDEDEFPGLFLVTKNLLKLDREVQVAVSLDDGKSFEAKGTVGWCRKSGEEEGPSGLGIEFTSFSRGGKHILDTWFEDNPPEVL